MLNPAIPRLLAAIIFALVAALTIIALPEYPFVPIILGLLAYRFFDDGVDIAYAVIAAEEAVRKAKEPAGE